MCSPSSGQNVKSTTSLINWTYILRWDTCVYVYKTGVFTSVLSALFLHVNFVFSFWGYSLQTNRGLCPYTPLTDNPFCHPGPGSLRRTGTQVDIYPQNKSSLYWDYNRCLVRSRWPQIETISLMLEDFAETINSKVRRARAHPLATELWTDEGETALYVS